MARIQPARGVRSRRLAAGSLTLVLAAALGAPAAAQVVTVGRVQYEQKPQVQLDCRTGGEWVGPFDYEHLMNPLLGRNPTYDDRDWAELTHAVLLPPPSDAPTQPSERVLLVARRYDTGSLANPGGDTLPLSFIWDRGEPATLTSQVVNPDASDASAELFCGGHALTVGGNVLFAGGTDEVQQMTYNGAFWSHRYVQLFMNKQEPYWVTESTATAPDVPPMPPMQRARWYPTAVRLADGSILVAGHGFNPVAVPDSAQTRERCDVDDVAGTLTWRTYNGSSLLTNVVGSSCGVSSLLHLYTYPRMYQLLSGDVFAFYVEADVLSLNACPDPAKPDLWRKIQTALLPAPGANSAHYIDLTPAGGPTETIYALGGAVEGTHSLASNRVLRMDVDVANPAASTWTNVGVPQLNSGRIFLGAVILLDGSLTAFGGVSQDPDSDVVTYSLHPERYEPPGIFAAPDTAWQYLNPEADPRSYHMVAVLLPTGEVLCAGGQGKSVFTASLLPDPAWYTAEIYKPAYMCGPARPTIESAPASLAFGAQDLQLDVKLHSSSSGGETRVALIGPGSMTHSTDSGEVYIKLKFTPFTPSRDPGQATTIHFDAPPSGNVAPPGWYLLTVVNSEGRPSEARWVQVGTP